MKLSGVLEISITDTEFSRGIEPTPIEISSYSISVTDANSAVVFSKTIRTEDGSGNCRLQLPVGNYTVKVSALNKEDKRIGEGFSDVEVVVDRITQCSVVIHEIQGKGTIRFVFSGAEDDALVAKVYDASMSLIDSIALDFAGGIFTGSIELDNGFYYVTVSKADETVLKADTVRVLASESVVVRGQTVKSNTISAVGTWAMSDTYDETTVSMTITMGKGGSATATIIAEGVIAGEPVKTVQVSAGSYEATSDNAGLIIFTSGTETTVCGGETNINTFDGNETWTYEFEDENTLTITNGSETITLSRIENGNLFKIAMVTDYGDITDQSFNQATYEACNDYATAQGLKFQYFKPTGDSTAERVKSITQAIESGYNVIVMPGYAFGEAIQEVAPQYKDTKFIALDVSEFDLDGTVPANVYAAVYQEELAGYFAGYAAVKLGYTKLGYLGGMAVPAVVRYGYGFVQGADAAAEEKGLSVQLKYAYANQFFGDADITAAMDTWYNDGTECVFACGGGVFTSVAEAAVKVGGKVIGVDVDQAPTIDGAYGAGLTVTSAMKGLYASTQAALKTIVEDKDWASLAGKSANLGLVSKDPELNYVGIPTGAGTQFSDKFTLDDYKAIVADILSGNIEVDNAIDITPTNMADNITVYDMGLIKQWN